MTIKGSSLPGSAGGDGAGDADGSGAETSGTEAEQGGQEAPKPQPPAAPAAPQSQPKPPEQPTGPAGFPADTPVAEMTAEQAAAYWKHQSRRHEQRAKESAQQVAALQPKADQYDQLEAASKTEHERALDEARAQVREETGRAHALDLVHAEFRVAAKGRLDGDRLATVLEPLDLSKFLTDDVRVDGDKVTGFVDGIAPTPQPEAPKAPDMGQGRRQPGARGGSVQAGRDLYRRFHPSSPSAAN